MLMGMILGTMMEEQLRRALLLSDGDPMIFVARQKKVLEALDFSDQDDFDPGFAGVSP